MDTNDKSPILIIIHSHLVKSPWASVVRVQYRHVLAYLHTSLHRRRRRCCQKYTRSRRTWPCRARRVCMYCTAALRGALGLVAAPR